MLSTRYASICVQFWNLVKDWIIQLFTKITAAFKRPVKNPKLLIQALVQWEKTGDLWSIVTDWLQSSLEKARDQNPTKRKRIRFSDPSSSALGFDDILRKSSFYARVLNISLTNTIVQSTLDNLP